MDLRDNKNIYIANSVTWSTDLTAQEAVSIGLDDTKVQKVITLLSVNSPSVIVAWHNSQTQEHSEVGGVGRLDWQIEDNSTLTITLQDETTTDKQLDASSEWLLENDSF